MLMVIVVIGIISAVTLPRLAQSIRGNRLRMAGRSVVSAGRFARSMAVMQQHEMELRFDLQTGRYNVEPSATGTRAGTMPGPKVSGDPAPAALPPTTAEGDAPPVIIEAGAMNRMSRTLDNVTFDYVESGAGMRRRTQGSVTIVFRTNGRCSPYRVRLVDADGAGTLISVDPLGAAEMKRE
jgi:Tfp pilus assembly protein FimT